MGGQSGALDDAVHRGFVCGHCGVNGGLLLGEFGDFHHRFRSAGLAGEWQLAEIVEDMRGIRDQCGPVSDELVTPGGRRLIDGAGHGENRFTIF